MATVKMERHTRARLMRYVRRLLFFVLTTILISASIVLATDFDDCASAAKRLKYAAEEASSAQSSFESAKSTYESACGYYGNSRGDKSACGPYGYKYSSQRKLPPNVDR